MDSPSVLRPASGNREKDIQSEVRQLQEQFTNRRGDAQGHARTALREAARFVTQLALNQNAAIIKSLMLDAAKPSRDPVRPVAWMKGEASSCDGSRH